jgi:fluoride exporter
VARFFWICVGGAVGTGARYLVTLWAVRTWGLGFPAGTLAVNLAGSFLLGFLMHLASMTQWMPPVVRLALTTGAMGGFTTYSTFNYETTDLLRAGAWSYALLNVASTLIGCLAAGVAGMLLARTLLGR